MDKGNTGVIARCRQGLDGVWGISSQEAGNGGEECVVIYEKGGGQCE